ncbi:MAG: hypothetical protein AAFR53_14260 [Pseudomonadota bacterium]
MSTIPARNIFARHLVWTSFRDPADEDYLAARIMARRKLIYPFYWNALQCLEKYTKCALILNGHSAKKIGHKITQSHEILKNISGGLLDADYTKVESLASKSVWNGSPSTSEFFSRVENMGNPDNRYRGGSVHIYWSDLHIFDEIAFRLRRICFPLKMKFSESKRTYYDELLANPRAQPHPEFSFLKSSDSKEARKANLAALAWRNFAYFPDRSVRVNSVNGGMSIVNSPVHLLSRMGRSDDSTRAADCKEAIKWFSENCKVNFDVGKLLASLN